MHVMDLAKLASNPPDVNAVTGETFRFLHTSLLQVPFETPFVQSFLHALLPPFTHLHPPRHPPRTSTLHSPPSPVLFHAAGSRRCWCDCSCDQSPCWYWCYWCWRKRRSSPRAPGTRGTGAGTTAQVFGVGGDACAGDTAAPLSAGRHALCGEGRRCTGTIDAMWAPPALYQHSTPMPCSALLELTHTTCSHHSSTPPPHFSTPSIHLPPPSIPPSTPSTLPHPRCAFCRPSLVRGSRWTRLKSCRTCTPSSCTRS
jgi:hypothetical protein